jgi:hypothetical protein
MLPNPNGIPFFAIQFAFNDPMGKSERPTGFQKLFGSLAWPGTNKIATKYLKEANIVNLEGKMLKFSNKSALKAKYWACIHYNLFNF